MLRAAGALRRTTGITVDDGCPAFLQHAVQLAITITVYIDARYLVHTKVDTHGHVQVHGPSSGGASRRRDIYRGREQSTPHESVGLPLFSKGASLRASSSAGLMPCFTRLASTHSMYSYH